MGKDIEESAKKTSTLSKAFNTLVPISLSKALQSPAQSIVELSKVSANFIEQLNVLDVAFRNNTNDIRKFTSSISETLNLDESTLISAASKFKTLANSMNIAEENGRDFSKMMTQLTLDTASLFNLDFNKAQSYLQNAALGRGTALKQQTGVSVLESTVQTNLEALGIDAYVKDMSDAEKAIARVISMSYQLRNAQGDLARTIEAPANQFRVLGEQISLAGRNIGNLFLPAIAAILPYVNAVLIVINKLLSALATLAGFSETSWDFFGDSDAAIDSFEDIGTAIGGVGDAASSTAKKLQGLRGFDKLNNLTTPSSGGGGSAGGGGGGVNPNLLKAMSDIFGNYNTSLDKVKTKATEIAESIMSWLGFTKELNPETGQIDWKYQGIKTTLKNMWNSFKNANPFVKTLVGYFGYLFGSKVIDAAKKLLNFVGNTGLFKAFKNLLTPLGNIYKYVKDYIKYAPTLKDAVKTGIDDWQAQASNIEKAKTMLSGFIFAAGGLYVVKESIESINESGMTLTNTLGLVSGSLSTILGGAMIGASIGGGTGAAIGAIAGAVAVLIDALINYKTPAEQAAEVARQNAEETREWAKAIDEKRQAIEKDAELLLSQQDWNSQLVDELYDIVDANGKVKAGYEDRAQFIVTTLNKAYGLELEISDGKINKNKEEIKSIEAVIKKKQAQIILETKEKEYTIALQEKGAAYQKVIDAQKKLSDANERYNDLIEIRKVFEDNLGQSTFKNIEYFDNLTGKTYKGMEAYIMLQDEIKNLDEVTLPAHQDALSIANETYSNYVGDITEYTDLLTAVEQNDYEKINSYIDGYSTTVTVNGQKVKTSLSDQLAETKRFGDDTVKKYEEMGTKVTDEQKASAYRQYNILKQSLLDQTSTIEDLTPDVVKDWQTLARLSREDYESQLSQLPENVRNTLKEKMKTAGETLSDNLQTGLDNNKPTVKINADTSPIKNALEGFFSRNSGFFNILGSVIGVTIPKLFFADGGLPSVGQMFIANERGPELIGQIGGQSFVANQNQMMDIIDKKLSNAGGLQNATFVIQVGNEEIARTVINDLQGMAKSNGKPITITG